MANTDFTSAAAGDGPKVVAPGITRNDCGWGYYLNGRKDDLLRAGLAKESWFADGVELDERGRVVRTKHVEWEGRSVTSKWNASSDHFYITVHYGQKELEAKDQSKRYEQMVERMRMLDPIEHVELLRAMTALKQIDDGLRPDPDNEQSAKLREKQSRTILKLVPNRVSEETVGSLLNLYCKARDGQLVGIACVAIYQGHQGRRYTVHTCGEAERNPTFVRGAVRALDDLLSEKVNRV
jgi:hypothetical protein